MTIHIRIRILIHILMNITTYIRKEDEEKWKAIPNKAEFIHAALNNLTPPRKTPSISPSPQLQEPSHSSVPKPIRPPRPPIPDIPGLTTANKIKSNGACKIHGLPLTSRNKCLQKGCKYA